MAMAVVRGRPSSRERILDAAAELVRDVGAGRLTLEAVAERAGLSKGGLLYNFPTKDALLQDMLERMIEEGSAEKKAFLRDLVGKRNAQARASIEASLKIRGEKMHCVANGMLAASAENPRLLEPVRKAIAEQWQAITQTSDDPDAAMVAWLAVEGLSSLEMHNLSPVSGADRARVISAVRRLLEARSDVT
jgi:AcrR family transcriptional regulator